MQSVSPVFGEDNTFLRQGGVWDSLVIWAFWIKWVKNEETAGRGKCVVDGLGRPCGFHGTLCHSLAYTRPAGGRCTLHTATIAAEPVCGGFWATDSMGSCRIPGNSAGLLPSQVIPCVYEWDTWVQAFPRQCTTVGSQGCEGKCAALRLVLCAIFTPFDVSGSVSRTSAAVLLLRISCGSSSHRLGNLR